MSRSSVYTFPSPWPWRRKRCRTLAPSLWGNHDATDIPIMKQFEVAMIGVFQKNYDLCSWGMVKVCCVWMGSSVFEIVNKWTDAREVARGRNDDDN